MEVVDLNGDGKLTIEELERFRLPSLRPSPYPSLPLSPYLPM